MLSDAENHYGAGPEGTARWLLGLRDIVSRPEVMAILGVVSLGGVLVAALPGVGVIGGLFCTLSTEVMCPDDPSAPGVPQPAPGPGDGDHR